MSILDKHPAPWTRHESGSVVDANVHLVMDEMSAAYGMKDGEAVERLILAAPVVLLALAAVVSEDGPRDLTPINLLVAWLKGEPGSPAIDLGEFVKWLRGGTANVIARSEGGE